MSMKVPLGSNFFPLGGKAVYDDYKMYPSGSGFNPPGGKAVYVDKGFNLPTPMSKVQNMSPFLNDTAIQGIIKDLVKRRLALFGPGAGQGTPGLPGTPGQGQTNFGAFDLPSLLSNVFGVNSAVAAGVRAPTYPAGVQ